MPRRPFTFLDDRTRALLWVEWARRRYHTAYGPASDACLKAMAEHLPSLPLPTSPKDRERAHTLQHLARLNNLLRSQPDRKKHEQLIWRLVRPLCQPELRAYFPPLAQFAYEWGIRLPLDPAIPTLPDWVGASVFPRDYDITLTYKMVYEDLNLWLQYDRELVVEFRIREGASHDVLREQFDAILAKHTHWNRARRAASTKQAYYETIFHVYNLHIQGQTFPAIAQQLWPSEWDSASQRDGTHKTLLQRARGHFKRARDLIYGGQK
jgi:hypothetical protein